MATQKEHLTKESYYMENAEFVVEFEKLLREQLSNLVAVPTESSRKILEESLTKCLNLFNLDRVTLSPFSMTNSLDNEYVAQRRTDNIPELTMKGHTRGDIKNYFNFLARQKKVTTLSQGCLKEHKVKMYRQMYCEGFRWHVIIPVHVHGKAWGVLCAATHETNESDLAKNQLERLKSLSDLWVVTWRYAILEQNLEIPEASNGNSQKGFILSKRQTEVLSILASGSTAKDCAEQLGLSKRTVETHKYKIMEIVGVKNQTELIQYAIKQNLIKS
ncbi:response regulator transcription factor [Vibrio crassostreae]|uniref:response regulator transcription factor n=1 Tax=Vibrio crassostreae TaxID=246167 RepID=UPI001B30F40C|nr:LuxR C-terminal-related transcriptional regulator [Vibrio crassostreae]